MSLFNPYGDEGIEYTEGPVRGQCNACDTVWTISVNATDGWHNECPTCGTVGDYRLDPQEGRRR